MDIKGILDVAERVKQFSGQRLNEEQTKNALILPLIKALGYDIFDPFEVCAEFTSDVGTKKGEKIDYAILRKKDTPVMVIECKPKGDRLDKGRCSQLRRYFQNHTTARIGVLTDGLRYIFFSDLQNKNLMDEEPFFECNFEELSSHAIEQLRLISKAGWEPERFIRSGEGLRQGGAIRDLIFSELDNPSDDFVRYFAGKTSKSARITSKSIAEVRPLVRRSLEDYVAQQINQRIDNLKVKPGTGSIPSQDYVVRGVYTTNTEIWGLLILRTMLHEHMDVLRLWIRDQKSYCSVLLDDNNRKTICRFYNFQDWDWGDENIGNKAYVHIFNTEKGEKVSLRFVDDLYPLKGKILEAVKRVDK